MPIGAIGGSAPYASPQAAGRPQGAEETTITIHCKNPECAKKRAHDRSCPHTVTTRPAPKAGENGYLLDKMV